MYQATKGIPRKVKQTGYDGVAAGGGE